MLEHDPPKGLPELPDAISVDEGVDHRVCVRQDDGRVDEPVVRALTPLAEVVEAVDDVQRQPAQSKEANDDGQRLGSMHLLLQSGLRTFGRAAAFWRGRSWSDFGPHLEQLAPCCQEDVHVDDEHEEQGQQHTAKKVEIDHVLHGDHPFEEAFAQACRAAAAACGGCGTGTCQRTIPLDSTHPPEDSHAPLLL